VYCIKNRKEWSVLSVTGAGSAIDMRTLSIYEGRVIGFSEEHV